MSRMATTISAPGAQSGRVRNSPLKNLVDDLGVHLDAGRRQGERGVATRSRRPTALVPTRTMRPCDAVGILRPALAGSRSPAAEMRGHARQAGEIDAELADRAGRHLEIADLQRRHRGLPGIGLAARAGSADHERACAHAPCAAPRPTAPDRVFSWLRATSGTTRTMPSGVGGKLKNPKPVAASFRIGMLASAPRNVIR